MTEEGSELTTHQIARREQATRRVEQLKDVNLDRRRFCQNILLLGAAAGVVGTGVVCISSFLEDPTPIHIPLMPEEVLATIEARAPSILATAEARTPEETQILLEELPDGVVGSTYMVMGYKPDKNNPTTDNILSLISWGASTSTLIEYDTERDIYLGVTNKHTFTDSGVPLEDIRLIELRRPQYQDSSMIEGAPVIVPHSKYDMAVFAISGKNIPFKLDVLGRENLEINHTPSDSRYYSLGFDQFEVWPTSYNVLHGSTYGEEPENHKYVGDALGSGGGSGSGVVNEDGKLVGVQWGGNIYGILFTTFDDEITGMMQQAVVQADERFNSK